jgi:hypothetical protein
MMKHGLARLGFLAPQAGRGGLREQTGEGVLQIRISGRAERVRRRDMSTGKQKGGRPKPAAFFN